MINQRKCLSLSALIGFSAICLYIWPVFFSIVLFLVWFVVIVLSGLASAIWVHIKLASPLNGIERTKQTLVKAENFHSKIMKQYESRVLREEQEREKNLPPIFGRTVDVLFQQLLEFVIRDHIAIHLKDLVYNTESIEMSIKKDLWSGIRKLHHRLSRIDHAKLIACDIVTVITHHFEKIREMKITSDLDKPPEFELAPHVVSEDKELEYLRTVSEILMVLLLPKGYSLSPAKGLVREVLCFKVFKEAIDEITDPDFFNRSILAYFDKNNQQASLPKKALDHVDLYIDKINDVHILEQIRSNVVSKLMQATTLQNLNRAKGLDLDNEKSMQNSGVLKSDINAAKRLQKTIGHLTRAKELCEKKLSSLGSVSGYNGQKSGGEDVKKVLPLRQILENITGRKYLSQYLQTLASHDLIRFWLAVEELRTAPKSQWHQLGAEIFYTFIRNPVSEIKVDKMDRKRMESFLLGDNGPEVFIEVQQQVMLTIEEKYFHSFVTSDYYKEMANAIEKAESSLNKTDNTNPEEKPLLAVVELFPGVGGGGINLNVEDHSNYARRKLDQLEEKLNNKVQALAALKASMRPDSKVLKKLQKEVEWLQGEKRQLEAHLSRTEMWSENLGKWTAIVQSAEVPDEREPPQFVLVVQMSENDHTNENGENVVDGGGKREEIASGWVVCRSLTQFQELHKKLRPLCAEVKSLDLPSSILFTKFLFGKPDKATLDRAKGQIQKYLDFVLKNDRLNQSEAVYAFLSPSSEHLKHSTPSPKKSRFSFATIFKTELGLPFSLLKDTSNEDISHCLDSLDTGAVEAIDFIKTSASGGTQTLKVSEDPRDTIAEPLYALLTEIFDMEGLFKYLRKTLIGFVQVTYGSSINRQIYESVAYFFSEEMLHFYIAEILRHFWPGGRPLDDDEDGNLNRSDEERAETAKKARENLVNNVPEILVTLVGGNAAKEGAKKIFDALQDRYFNKQLFYEILEVILDSVFPELH
ncbi:sorting nexin-25 isoform X2 [Anthonomus grandis grandis]|uniref:sorting nexin-25 isoform X2 n=1 Tax=Anthonomus grandis grandis TaxID=2921223 RepID=UPI0021650BB5|nr:sorting nexin-25 isoform X2 [Anthonomus grandis grandis]